MRARFLSLWVALVLPVSVSGAWAQSTGAKATQSIDTLEKQAASGDATAQNDLGYAYSQGRGVPHDDEQAFAWYLKAAEQGLALAQNNVAFAYRDGKGVLQDYAHAATWFRKAAEQGNSSGQYNLGVLYYAGEGVPQDFAESYFWLDIAAPGMLGNSDQKWVANYRDAAASKLTPSVLLRTQERARKWFEDHAANAATQKERDEFEAMKQDLRQSQEFPRLKERAEAGGAIEQYQVGYSYEIGDQAPQDYAQAAQWYQKSANQGFAAAQFSLGMLYEKNLGVPRDYEKAYFWLSLAASGYPEEREGHSLRLEVVSARDSAAEHLTSAKLLQVQERTAAFLATHPKSY